MNPLSEEILTFWFGATDLTLDIEKRQVWFKSTAEFDRHLIDHYSDICSQAHTGALDHLRGTPADCLTLILALDQFPRNIYRGSPQAFDCDPKAREIARYAMTQGFDQEMARWQRTFLYLPFEHSENMEDQEKALELYSKLVDAESLQSAIGHHDAIKRFGRFPHRNAVLGRINTPEEEEYLKDPPMWGKTALEAAELKNGKNG
jgi:uncharacterized protein (DUF924 family)